MTTPTGSLRADAEQAATMIADKLSDTDAVLRSHSGELAEQFVRVGTPWQPMSLEGATGMALLFAELSGTIPGYRALAHRLLADLGARAEHADVLGLSSGLGALGFGLTAAARSASDYAQALTALDQRIGAVCTMRARAEQARMREHTDITRFHSYDAFSGLSGIGRYLLRRGQPCADALAEVLTALVALSRPRPDGLPGWWVDHKPRVDAPEEAYRGGHGNFGLAHGAAGPLALLALAWQHGVRVEGHQEAIERIAHWYVDRAEHDEHGVYWPTAVTREHYLARTPNPYPRASWCYGTPGIARALQLAAMALDDTGWHRLVGDSVLSWLRRTDLDTAGIHDPGLCHGWGGLVHLTRLLGRDLRDPEVLAAVDGMVERTLGLADPEARFGVRCYLPTLGMHADFVGLVQGAAGTALALHAYATGTDPVTGWDTALLVA